LGDETELRALQEVFGNNRSADNPLLVGSVKSNVGHLESAAGSLSMIKTVLCLQKKMIPPVVHFRELTQDFDPGDFPVQVPSELVPWDDGDGTRFAGISAFNFAGGNVHVVLEEAPDSADAAVPPTHDRDEHLLVLSAKTEKALTDLANLYLDYFARDNPEKIGYICYTAGVGRSHFKHRLALRARDCREMHVNLSDFIAENESSRIGVATLPQRTPDDQVPHPSLSSETPLGEISAAYLRGAEIPWDLLYGTGHNRKVELPTYPFQRRVCWLSPEEISGPPHNNS
jgi:acyl transferase domain-containing protein